MENLVSLKEMEEIDRLDKAGELKLNLTRIAHYGAYLSGAQAALRWIMRNGFFADGKAISKDSVLREKAIIELALKSKMNTDRLLGDYPNVNQSPIYDKKGKLVGYEAKFYMVANVIVET